MRIIMSGLDYQKAPIGLREQLSFTKTQVGDLTERIAGTEGVLGCVLISTCNRTELYLSCAPECPAEPDQLLCRAVDLLTGGLKEHIRPEDLERCVGKIRVHTAARGQREGGHERKHITLSPVC